MRPYIVHKKTCWKEKVFTKERDEDTGVLKEFVTEVLCKSSMTVSHYNNITRGRAKRIARNHYLRFRPKDCGMEFRKMKDKKYIPSAGFVYTSHNRRLVIRINGTVRKRVIGKTLIEE